MWARLIGSVFILAGGIVCARSADEGIAVGLEFCFKAARIADAICSKLPNDPAQRLDCFQKTRAAQLECLEHVLSETPAGPSAPRDSSSHCRPDLPPMAHCRRVPQSKSRPNNLAAPVHRECRLEAICLRNPIARRRQILERTHRNCLRRLKRRLELSDQTSLPKQLSVPRDRPVRIGS